MSYYIGLDLGGTNLKTAVVDGQGGLLAKMSVPTIRDQGPEPVITAMVDSSAEVVSQAGLKMSQIAAVGIGSPGPIDMKKGLLISAPNLPDFRDVPIRDRIAAAIGKPTFLDNDANVAAFAEYWIGAGRDPSVRDLVALTLGTGIGSGLIIDGKILHGAFGSGGEAGHMIVQPNGRQCGCGQLGCLETYTSASHTAIRAAEAVEAAGPDQHTTLRKGCFRCCHCRGSVSPTHRRRNRDLPGHRLC
jgi:glucokinase